MGYAKNTYLTVTDQFCGAGGSSIGAQAAGADVKLAMNHWRRAIETHNANFPDVAHVCADISATNPRLYPTTDVLITSPECTNHSLAKGVKRRTAQLDAFDQPLPDEAAERSRATMWDVPRFAEFHHYNAIIVENVVEAKKWPMYEAWLMAMHSLDYLHREVFFNSMFAHPTPQSRDRMYVVFWKRGNKAPNLDIHPLGYCATCEAEVATIQSWKNPAKPYGKYRQQYVYRCGSCAGLVEPYVWGAWSAIDWSIRGERIGDRDRPLAPATMARIQAGIDKYWAPGIVDLAYNAQKMRSVGEPIFTQSARQSLGLFEPFLTDMRGTDPRQLERTHRPVSEPTGTVSAGGIHHGVVEHPDGLLIKVAGSTYEHGKYTRARTTDQVFPTQSGTPETALVVPINGGRHGDGGHKVRTVDEPFLTQTADLARGLVVPLSMRQAGDRRTRSADDPFVTVTTVHEQALVTPAGGTWRDAATPTADPLPARTASDNDGPVRAPDAFLASYYSGSTVTSDVREPAGTVTSQDRHALIERGPRIDIEDCSFRMLQPHEIQRAMAFPADYRVTGTQREKVRQLGNAVTPPVMSILFRRVAETMAS